MQWWVVMSNQPQQFRQHHITRALKAAAAAGQQLYAAHRKGAYAGREAEWAQQESYIIAAGREGRIEAPDYITK
jgi:hypothetical protein